MIFNTDLKLHGEHAELIKKYSKDKQAEEQYKFNIKDNFGRSHNTYIFETMIQAYMVSAMIGIIDDSKIDHDSKKEPTASIFTQVLINNKTDLERIVQYMILSKNDNLSIDLKIKSAFSINKDKLLEDEVTAYSRYGMQVIDSYFKECDTQEDVINQLLSFMRKYSIEEF